MCVLPPLDQKGVPEHAQREDTEDEMEHKDVATVETGEPPDSSIPEAIILDLSPVNFLDTVGVKTLRNVRTEAVLLVSTRLVETSPPLPLSLVISLPAVQSIIAHSTRPSLHGCKLWPSIDPTLEIKLTSFVSLLLLTLGVVTDQEGLQ